MAQAFQPRTTSRAMSRRRRHEIEAEIAGCLQRVEVLIARLDRQDAPFEDMEEDDHSGDAIDTIGEAPADDGAPILPIRPLYAIDQTKGPINEREGYRAWQRSGGCA